MSTRRRSPFTEPLVSRRAMLRSSGVALALPLLDSMLPAMGAERMRAPQRMVAINIPLGFYAPEFLPTETGRGYALSSYLEEAADLRDDFTVVSGTSHPDVDGGHAAEKSFLTAAPHPGSRSFRNSVSLDQFVAGHVGEATRFASLTLGDHSMSWSANGVSIPALRSPTELFAKLFLQGNAEDVAATRARLEDGQSIMDTLLDEARAMQPRVSRADRDKLDQYFTAVRETEHRLAKSRTWLGTPKPTVDVPPPRPVESADVTGRLRTHFDGIRLALATDSTRVVTLGGNGGSEVPPLAGVGQGYHALSHHGMNPQMISELKVVERETVKAWADFLRGLARTPEGDARLLDNTQVLLGSNLGNASGHLTTNLPIVLAGGRFRHGQHLSFDSRNDYPLPNLFVSMLQGQGLEVTRFASSTGTMTGLEQLDSWRPRGATTARL